MQHFDTIIVGAGPAGLSCAEELGKQQKVLIIDKQSIPIVKVCGEGLTILSNEYLNLSNEKFLSFKKQNFTINDKNVKFTLEYPLITFSRINLYNHQFNQIKNNQNITFKENVRLIDINKDYITTTSGIFYYKNLIGADGSNSLVRKYLGLKTKFIICFQYKIHNLKYPVLRFIFNTKILKTGYAWIFPLLDYVNIGCGFDPSIVDTQKALGYLKTLFTKYKIDYKNEPLEAAPINYYYTGWKFNNIFLAGDAAGFTSAFTGEGISFAIISGQEIAKYILNNKYKTPYINKILEIKGRQEKCLKIINKLKYSQIQSVVFLMMTYLMRTKKIQMWFIGYKKIKNHPRAGRQEISPRGF